MDIPNSVRFRIRIYELQLVQNLRNKRNCKNVSVLFCNCLMVCGVVKGLPGVKRVLS